MRKELFEELLESVKQAKAIERGEDRRFDLAPDGVAPRADGVASRHRAGDLALIAREERNRQADAGVRADVEFARRALVECVLEYRPHLAVPVVGHGRGRDAQQHLVLGQRQRRMQQAGAQRSGGGGGQQAAAPGTPPADTLGLVQVEPRQRGGDAAEKAGVVIMIENVWNNLWVKPAIFQHFVASFQNPWIRTYFDIGNHVKYAPPEQWITHSSRCSRP